MYRLIADNIGTLLADPKLRSSVRDYAELRERFRLVDVSRDLSFQKLYRRFWALNAARLSSSWCDEYFRILEREKGTQSLDLRAIVGELRGLRGDGALHVSFASKLVHMVNPHRPIYDRLVAAAYFFRAPVAPAADRRLDVLLDFYCFLETEYAKATASDLLKPAIAIFRSTYPESATFSAVKVLDFLLWTCVRLLNGGAQRRGQLQYELARCSS
jgi:hypothetical protein